MSNLARIVIEEYPSNNFSRNVVSKFNAATAPLGKPPCFEEFYELIHCLNKKEPNKCAQKYECFTECFKKFYK